MNVEIIVVILVVITILQWFWCFTLSQRIGISNKRIDSLFTFIKLDSERRWKYFKEFRTERLGYWITKPYDAERSINDDISSNDSYTPIASAGIIGDDGYLTKHDYETWEKMYNEISNLPTKDSDQDN